MRSRAVRVGAFDRDKIGGRVNSEKGNPVAAGERGVDLGFEPEPFRPARWLPGAHAQTIAGRLLRRRRAARLVRERIELPDGDFLDLDIGESVRRGAPLVLLLHGLEGSARRGYALNTYAALEELGVGAIGLNFRGCSGEPNRLPRAYHSGDTGDLRTVLDVLHARYPGSPLGIVGFSLGGNVLLKWLGEEGAAAATRVVACAAISVPYDLAACAEALEQTAMGRFYMTKFLKTLRAKTIAKPALVADTIDLARVRRARTFREFDDAATAPLHGFTSALDYYTRSSSAAFLDRIRVPTLLIHAEDDPFLPARALPWASIRANPALVPLVTPAGGHVGFVTGRPWAPRFWVEQQAARFLARRLLNGPRLTTLKGER